MRHAFLLAVAGWVAFAAGDAALAQSKQKLVVIGWLSMGSKEGGARNLAAFREGLSALGWKEGSQIVLEARWADGSPDRLPVLAEELVAKKPAVIVAATGSRAVTVAVKAAPRIPVVQASGGDLVAAGLAASLARPSGMVTGISNIPTETSEKYLELLLAAAPKLKRVGFLMDPNVLNPALQTKAAQRAAAQHSVDARFAQAPKAEDVESATAALAKQGAEALIVMPSPLLTLERRRILKLASTHRWPVVGGSHGWSEDGALLSYGVDATANYRRAAYYVDRIVKGTKPGDLPIEQATRFELVVNAKTAKVLGLRVPQELLVRADKVIE